MADVWLGRINRGIEKLFNVKGGPTVVDVTHTVHPVYEVMSGTEDRYLQGWSRFFMQMLTTPVAAQNGACQLRNPPGSGIVVVIERNLVFNGATSVSNLALSQARAQTTDLTNPGTGIGMDARNQANSVAIPSNTSNGTNLANIVIQIHTTDTLRFETIQTHNQEITLLPGDAVRWTNSTVNEGLDCSWWWRERALESSELT